MVVNEPPSKTIHEPSLYRKYCLTDAIRIARFYEVEFPKDKLPNEKVVTLAQRILCSLEKNEFISSIAEISSLVWSGNESALEALITEKTMSEETTLTTISKNEDQRDEVCLLYTSPSPRDS